MPITALPLNAIQAIGSLQVLTDPASMVKELLDNAIDGRATRISIELSANTLDDIRVKDNGHGIAPDDRAMMCTRHCTSKIRNLHDLEVVGGQSLGFRGEALASAAEMAGILTITTRIEGEATAAELKFDRGGQISSQKRASHPVGTTVRVQDFLRRLPVRRQAAEKTAVKMLAKVRKMLQSYALTRPHLRLSLKILKAKDRKGDWTYPKGGALSASRAEASFNAATDIFGKKLTSECESSVSTWSSAGEQIDEIIIEPSGSSASSDEAYTLEAIVAKKDCDGSVLSNVGQFLSVDSRPVSCARGTLKQIISSYKSHLRSTIASGENAKIVDPFLCLNIRCPRNSYDANVEPAKDDVLFTNPELVLEITQRWLYSVYGEIKPTSLNSSAKTTSADKPRGIEFLFAREKAPVESARKDLSPVIASTSPVSGSASKTIPQTQPLSGPLPATTCQSSAIAPLRSQNGDEVSGKLSHLATRHPATDRLQAKSFPNILPSHDVSTTTSTEGPSTKLSSHANHSEKPVWHGSMYAQDDDEVQTDLQGSPQSPVDLDLDGDEHLGDVNTSNPWSFAKLNAATRNSARNTQFHTPVRQSGDAGDSTDPPSEDLPRRDGQSMLQRRSSRIHQARSSPEGAYPTPGPFPFPQKARGKRKAGDTSGDTSLTPPPSDVGPSTRGALDTWVQKSLGHYDQPDDGHTDIQDKRGPPDLPYSGDFVPARSLPSDGTPLSEIPDSFQRPRRKPAARKQQQGNIDKPFVSPVNDPNRVWFDIGENPPQRRPQRHRQNRNARDSSAAAAPSLSSDDIEDADPVLSTSLHPSLPSTHPDLAITLDYEARKQKASETHRRLLREQAAAAAANITPNAPTDRPDPLHPQHTTSSPHKNRQAKAIAALHTSAPSPPHMPVPLQAEDHNAALDPSDPRAYLLRIHQREQQAPDHHRPAGKSRRRKTALLPLETINEEAYTGDLTLVVEDVNAGDVEEDMKDSGAWDRYVRVGEVGDAFADVDVERVKAWEGMLKGLVGKVFAAESPAGEGEGEQQGADIHVDLVKILQTHTDSYA